MFTFCFRAENQLGSLIVRFILAELVRSLRPIRLIVMARVAESVATLPRRGEPSKDLVSQSLSSKLTCEREMAQKALELLLTAHSAFERERSAHKALDLLLTAQSAFERERERSAHNAIDLLLTAQRAF